MQNFFTAHLFNSVSRCLKELSNLQRKIQIEDPSLSDDPSEQNDYEYFKSNREIADFFGCGVTSINLYKRSGILTSYPVNGAAWYKISEVMEAVKLHPFLQNLLDKKTDSPKSTSPKIVTRIHHFDKNLMFIYLSYQGWRCTIASPALFTSEAISALCLKVIRLRHKIRPFQTKPD